MDTRSIARRTLLVVQATIAVTSLMGGGALIIGSLGSPASWLPSLDYLAGSPFADYLVPGILLAVVVGGLHLLAFVLLLRRADSGPLFSSVAAFAMLIWIFVQMVFIPFSPLQAVYFALGLAEAGLVMVVLGLFAQEPRTA